MRPTRPLTLLAYALTVLGFSVVSVSQSAHADVRKLEIDKEKSVVQWLGKKVSGQHNGTLNIKSGTVSLDGEQIVGGSFVLDMNTIANEDIESPKWKAKLEEHLKSNDFFNIAKFPEGTFEITKSEPGEQPSDVLLTGKLTVKGLTFPITFPAKVTKTGKPFGVMILEDFTGSSEIMLWGETFVPARDNGLLESGKIIRLKCAVQVDDRTGGRRLTGYELSELKPKRGASGKGPVELMLWTTRHSERDLAEIQETLAAHPGNTPVLLHFQNSAGRRVTVETNEAFNVKRSAALETALGRWLGD